MGHNDTIPNSAEEPGTQEPGPNARLLIVDDEPLLRSGLRNLLSLMGYEVEEAASGRQALDRLQQDEPYDLMVLDMRMPGMSGVEVMRRARQMDADLAIIVLTAHASLESTITAIKTNAADYLLKPISLDDLAATISQALQERAEHQRRQHLLDMIGEAVDILRQPEQEGGLSSPAVAGEDIAPSQQDNSIQVGPLALDCEKRLVVFQADPDRAIELTEGEAAILATLMKNAGQVLSCSQLAYAVTGQDLGKWESQNLVRTCIHRLRRKVEPSSDSPQIIRTVRGRGYFYSVD